MVLAAICRTIHHILPDIHVASINQGRGVIDVTVVVPVKVASKSLYKTSAVSLFVRHPMPMLLAARSIAAHTTFSHIHTLTCFAFFTMDFQGKERLLAVYNT